jgi:hypothetical protein
VGIMGHYIDSLPERARDRVIEAQQWCVASVVGPGGARCLVGHAEDWHAVSAEGAWRRWMEGEVGGDDLAGVEQVELLCRPELFAFRRAIPADLTSYRERLLRWGASSEGRIGARFDRLCARHGVRQAVRLVKARAGKAISYQLSAIGRHNTGPASEWVPTPCTFCGS